MDHAQSEGIIKRSADTLPFDSIAVDMSHYEKATNVKSRELVEYCNQRQIATETEPGRIEGGDDGIVEEFVITEVNALAPAFGNVHGEFSPRGPQLDFDR